MEKILKNLIGPSKGSAAGENGSDHQLQQQPQHHQQQLSPTKSSSRIDEDPEVRMEEKLRQKAFAHYDVQSLAAKTVHAVSLCAVLAKRRNTTTGASAASQAQTADEGHDAGDNRSNDLVLSCPYFRNELGGEEERVVSLCRETGHSGALNQANLPFLHRPNLACGLSLLEDANERRWRLKSCPYQRVTSEKSFIIENLDIGATYYREHFYGLEHQNWFGVDETVGPIAISIRKERIGGVAASVESSASSSSSDSSHQIKYQYRLILRTSDLSVLRGTVYDGCVPGLSHSSSRHNHHLNHHAKEVLEYLVPEISLSCLRLGVLNADEQLLKLDEQVLTRTYKVGVLFCRDGQGTEEEMYNNEHASPAFDEFLTVLGDRVRLKGFPKYRAGLDSKTDTTGSHSVYTSFNDCEVMFHVSTLLPYTPNNKQQLLRKRHIGNDIVTIIFQDPHAKPFTPKTIRSHFQHVFIVVRQILTGGSAPTKYSVAVSRSKEVPVFGPPIPAGAVYTKSKSFSDFLLSKIINAENAAHRSDKFRSMAQRTRFEYLKDLASNYISNTTLSDVSIGTSAGAKLVSSIFGASRKSRSNRGAHFVGDAVIRGAIMWDLSVQDYGQPKICDCSLAISGDTFLLMEESSKELIFVIPNIAILGWTSHSTHIRIYYHQGESLLLYSKDPDVDEISEIVARLRSVTNGCETQEMILRRNSVGQLGFHVTHEGIVTDVESYAFAWQVGLRHNFRIVEICKVAIATLDLEQVTDLLKTSITVSVTVLPPNADNSPRRGCNLTNCSYLTSCLTNGSAGEGEYENISGLMERSAILGGSRRKRGPVYGPAQRFGHPVSKSTPVSPEHHHSHLSGMNHPVSPPRGPIRKNSTLKASPTSAFSPLTPAISLSEFSDNSNRLMSGPALHSHHYYSHHSKQFGSGSNLIKTRSEMSLTNPSPPPGSYSCAYPVGRRYPSPSRSHSQHFGKVYKPAPIFVPSVDAQSRPAPPKPKPGPGSGYYSDSSSVQDVWSLPPFLNPLPNPVLAARNGRPATLSTTSSSAFHSLERKDSSSFSHTETPPFPPSASSYAARTKSPRSAFPSSVRSASDRLRVKSGSTKSSNSSCNGSSSSTLQEDLLKLISPEYRTNETVSSSSGADTASTTQYSTPYSSLERTKVNGESEEKGEEILTIAAQPAHVLPSTPSDAPSSRAPVPKPPRASVQHPLLQQDGEIDWPSLVDTATRAIARSKELGRETDPKVLEESLAFFSEFSAGKSSSSLPADSVRLEELKETVEKLQSDLVRQQRENDRLKDENHRLQEESQTAAAQLRKFTQWFFANVNAK